MRIYFFLLSKIIIYIYIYEGWENGMIITNCQPLFSTFYNNSPKGCTSQRSKDFSELGDDVEFCTLMEEEGGGGGGWRFKGVWAAE